MAPRDCLDERLQAASALTRELTTLLYCYLTFTDFSVCTVLRMLCLLAPPTNLCFPEGKYFLEDNRLYSKLFLAS